MSEIIQGDCLEVMKTFPDNHFSGIVTDPPYGLEFMNKGWDYDVPQMSYWKEALRITKPGSFLISMGGTRTFHLLCCAIEDAGFEIRDCLMYLYGSGFPKSHNHFGAEGYGTALKPAYEPIIMAMKPLDGTFKQNYEKWGVGGLNIDACRIGTDDTRTPASKNAFGIMNDDGWKCKPMIVGSAKGRWPANLLLDEEAAAMLDKQSGVSKSTSHKRRPSTGNGFHGNFGKQPELETGVSDSGGASRFFYCAKTSSRERNDGLEGFPIVQVSDGRGSGLSNGMPEKSMAPQKNHHPTVKPLALMRYLITLISPPTNALILDPFAGSGSTIVAATELGIAAIGIEKQQEYAEIAKARVLHAANKASKVAEQMSLF